MLHDVYFDQGRVAKSGISADIGWATNPNVQQYPHDEAKANQLLDQAGLARGADGMRFKSTFVHATSYAKYVLGTNLFADGLQAALDPRLAKR
jgi:ABC-type transport system substrate-binding protein